MSHDHFKGLSVLLIHSHEKHWHHDHHHPHGCQTGAADRFEQKERRYPEECRHTKTDQLPLGQIEHDLALDLCQISGH